ncbi:MAG: hypothetical protein BJ554DRAFT_888 [Olpidium bornovanus]|uniref:Uncharacterized protein n=1 Tax=Olpidium bornovanus TaxID=278681 RepID=A0A8H7ZSP9_9FUNG|nr:MAG: hypothetical protein BJ554DRAFT_888 [Olpidium bornovanus]
MKGRQILAHITNASEFGSPPKTPGVHRTRSPGLMISAEGIGKDAGMVTGAVEQYRGRAHIGIFAPNNSQSPGRSLNKQSRRCQ